VIAELRPLTSLNSEQRQDVRRIVGEVDVAPVFGAILERGGSHDHVYVLSSVGEVLALAAITRDRPALGWGQLSYAVSQRYRQKGFGRAVANGAVARAFGELGLGRLTSSARPSNLASRRILEALGFLATTPVDPSPGADQEAWLVHYRLLA